MTYEEENAIRKNMQLENKRMDGYLVCLVVSFSLLAICCVVGVVVVAVNI